jgi:hypothetical protein
MPGAPRTPQHSILDSGAYHERDAFGMPMVNREKYDQLYSEMKAKHVSDSPERMGVAYLPRKEAMDLILETALPLKPKQPFIVGLRDKIVQKLGVEDPKSVRVFSAVKTPLDIYHGVDAFVRYTPTQGKPIDVTLDITEQSSKENFKADVVLTSIEVDPDHNRRQFDNSVAFAAEDVVSRIKKELALREQRKSSEQKRRAA